MGRVPIIPVLLFLSVLTHASELDSLIIINKNSTTIGGYLDQIDALENVHLSYKPEDIELYKHVKIETDSVTVNQLLCKLFYKSDIFYKKVQKQIILYKNTDKSKYAVNGKVFDSETQERLIGAAIVNIENNKGVIANAEGYFLLQLKAGYYKVQIAYIGYKPVIKTILVNESIYLDIDLYPSGTIDEVRIYGEEAVSDHNSNMKLNLPSKKINQLPLSFGETDVLKTIQFLPGVQAGMEGTSGIYVRGGDMGQNQILLDGIPIYHAGHMLGIFSLINTSSIQKATLVKGGFPAKYGGAASSYLNVYLKEGNKNKHTGEFSAGLLTLSGMAEGPLSGGQGSYMISARRTWLDLLEIPIVVAVQGFDDREYASYYFGDIQTKITRKINDKNKLAFNIFKSSDKYKNLYRDYNSESKEVFKWGTTAASFSWICRPTVKQQVNTTLIFHQYKFAKNQDYDIDRISANNKAGTTNLILKSDVEYFASNQIKIDYGAEIKYNLYNPNVIGIVNYNLEELIPVQRINIPITYIATIGSIYSDLNYKGEKGFTLNLGLRASTCIVDNKTRSSIQPRIFVRQKTGKNSSVFAAFDRTVQYKQLLTTTRLTIPTDLWVPVTDKIAPLQSNQISAGYHINLNNKYRLTTETYLKQLFNCLDISNNSDLFNLQKQWTEKVETGSGRAYGFELLVEKTSGKINGWASYTNSRTFRTFKNINQGKEYPYRFDKPHVVQIAAIYKIKENISLSANWIFANGMRFTYPEYTYQNLGREFSEYSSGSNISTDLISYENKNEYQYPNYHRLDLGIEFKKFKKRTFRLWTIGIYNAYLKYNPYYVESYDGTLYGTALLPTIPFVKYTVKY